MFLICVAVFLVGICLFFVMRRGDESYSSEYTESTRQDTVVYNGKEYQYNQHLSNYLFMGIDTREPITEYETRKDVGRADTIFLLSYDRVEKTLRCFSIPRDTMANVRVIAVDGTDLGISKEHINMQYAFGDGKHESCRLVKEAVSDIFYDIPIQGYCSLNMDGIAVAVDVLGGVEVVVPDDSMVAVNPEFVKGAKVNITKENAEQFIRHRDTEESQSAIVRTNRQKVLIQAVSQKAKAVSSDNTNFVVDIYDSLKPYMVTNMGNDVLAKLLEADFDTSTGMLDVPGKGVEGEMFDEYHINEDELYELILQIFYEQV